MAENMNEDIEQEDIQEEVQASIEVLDSYNNIKRLSDEELEELWNAYLHNRNNKQLHNELVIQYIYLTKYVVNRVKVRIPPSFDIDDILSFGIEGLMNAIERFDPAHRARFETYAIFRIKGTIIDKIRKLDWIPRSKRKKIKDVKTAIDELRMQLGRIPTSVEVGAHLGITKEKVNDLLTEDIQITSLQDKKFDWEDKGTSLLNTVADPNEGNFLESLDEQDIAKKLQYALKQLPERERMIMVLYYHENMTFKEIGANINISESRVCQIHARAIMKLRNILQKYHEESIVVSK